MRPCRRAGCGNALSNPTDIVCIGDIHALANMCRGKKPVGQPLADQIAATRDVIAYRCQLCRQYHNGRAPALLEDQTWIAAATVAALREDPRIGPDGLLRLADAWRRVPRAHWFVGIDQREAFAVSSS